MQKITRFLVWTLLIVAVCVGILRGVAIRWWRVPEDDPILEASLAPTLKGGDLVLLWRLTSPNFGDLVVCPDPEADERIVVGRIVGEAGDRVGIKDEEPTLNGKAAHTEHACEDFEVADPSTGQVLKGYCQIEALSGHSHRRGTIRESRFVGPPIEKEVEEGRAFLLSDNRSFPYDSRDFGTVVRSACKETVVFRIVSREGYFDTEHRFSVIR
jgi:signal peptidase I